MQYNSQVRLHLYNTNHLTKTRLFLKNHYHEINPAHKQHLQILYDANQLYQTIEINAKYPSKGTPEYYTQVRGAAPYTVAIETTHP